MNFTTFCYLNFKFLFFSEKFFFTHDIYWHPQPTTSTHYSRTTTFSYTQFTQQDGRKERTAKRAVTLVSDKRDKAITCMLCRDLHFTLMFSGHLLKDLFKGGRSLARRFFKQNC